MSYFFVVHCKGLHRDSPFTRRILLTSKSYETLSLLASMGKQELGYRLYFIYILYSVARLELVNCKTEMLLFSFELRRWDSGICAK